MIASHVLVIHSLLYSVFLALVLFCYRFIYPRKKIPLIVVLFFISCLPVFSMFRPGTYQSGDLSSHIVEGMSFYKSLSQGNIVPLWAGDMNEGYGYPAFLFTYPLPFYLIAIVHFLGASFINSTKIVLALSFIFSGIFMYLFLKKLFTKVAAFVGSLCYLFFPYHLVDLHFRVDIGEVVAFVFIPLCLYSAILFIKTRNILWLFIESFSFACLLLSHPAISLAGYPVIIVYILYLLTKEKNKINMGFFQLLSIITSVFLTTFYWLPLFFELRYTLITGNKISMSFLSLDQLLYSPWRYGLLFQGPEGQLSFLIGYVQFFIIAFSLFLLFKKKLQNYHQVFVVVSLIIIAVCFFLMPKSSNPIWHEIPFIGNFQFTYRLLGIVMIAVSVLAAIISLYINKRWIFVLCLLLIFSTILNWGNRKNLADITDSVLLAQTADLAKGNGITQGITYWADPKHPWADMPAKEPAEVISGSGFITQTARSLNQHKYMVTAKSNLQIKENTWYFPGWKVFVDKKNQPITIFRKSEPKGLISFSVPKGQHIVTVQFTDTKPALYGKVISFVTVIFLIFSALLLSKIDLFGKQKLSKK